MFFEILPWATNNLNQNKYLFSGKEYQDASVGGKVLGLYDFGSRFYNPILGRWFNPDPRMQMASPYDYCGNSPMMHSDPDGEFFHLIIGAVIGGVLNAISGDGWDWGRFAVGAFAGALGAGVGGGISSSLSVVGKTAGGGFSAGFWGTSADTTATSSFASGAAIGAGAGFSSGFTTGFGNALLDGRSFGQALGQGGVSGLMGAGSGAVIGGLWGGIDAAIDGRTFWDGATVTRERISQSVTGVASRTPNDCLGASLESIDISLGNGSVKQQNVRGWGLPDNATDPNGPLDIEKALNGYKNVSGNNYASLPEGYSMDALMGVMKDNNIRLILQCNNIGQTVEHSTVISTIIKKTITKADGSQIFKHMINVMDPGRGGSIVRYPLREVKNIIQIAK